LPVESMEFRRLLAPNGIVHEPQLWIRVDTTHETQTLRLASQVVVSDQELFVV
jgi:hypothetical protein